MIKLFRTIRQKLLQSGKLRSYTAYAIGEIFLVVIGILIALQINNWNEKRIAFAKSKDYLTEMLKDLEGDTILFNVAINRVSNEIKKEEWALEQRDYTHQQADSLYDSFSGYYFEYSINDRTFQKIQNSQDSKLVGFDSVYVKISHYYTVLKSSNDVSTAWDKKEVTERQNYLRGLENSIEYNDHWMDTHRRGILYNKFGIRQDSMERSKRIIAFANSTLGRNHYKKNYIRHLRIRENFEDVKSAAIFLISAINKELFSQ